MATRSSYTGSEARDSSRPTEYDEVSGWYTFAGAMLAIVGILNFIYGIAAIDNANFYVKDTRYVVSDLNTWGWVLLILGAVQVAAACSLFLGNSFGRWIGIATAGLNAIAQIMFLPAYPWLSLALFSLDILILYGLIAHAGHQRA